MREGIRLILEQTQYFGLVLSIGAYLFALSLIHIFRYGVHPSTIPRWKKVLEIKDYFEEQMGCTIYEALPCGGRLQHL